MSFKSTWRRLTGREVETLPGDSYEIDQKATIAARIVITIVLAGITIAVERLFGHWLLAATLFFVAAYFLVGPLDRA